MNRLLAYFREGRNYLIALVVLLALTWLVMHWVVAAVGGDRKPVMVSIPKGASAWEVATRLRDKGLIRFRWVFPFMANLTGEARSIKAGAYLLDRSMSVRQILEHLAKGDVAALWVTIPEGFTTRQIADRLAAKHLVKKQEFLVAAQSCGKDCAGKLDMYSPDVEGYLFPATYLVPMRGRPADVIKMMLETFEKKVAKPLGRDIERVSADATGESKAAALYRIITVASLVESEAKTNKDRPLISAVIWNRLSKGMKLDIDATVEYALGGHRARIYYKDLAVSSPYNTYTHAGLPPGPICNPGLPSIKAALHPANVGYLYYVARPDGSHVFSNTLEEHAAAKRKVRKSEAVQ